MPEFPYSDDMYSGLDDSDDEVLYAAHAGLGLGDSSYVPGGMGPRVDQQQEQQQQQQQPQPDEDVILSPSDGYFGRSGPTSVAPEFNDYPSHPYTPPYAHGRQETSALGHVDAGTSWPNSLPASSQVPHVPNVWVSDPSLEQGSTAESKAREAREEREQNRRLFDHNRLNSSLNPAFGPPHHHSPSTSPQEGSSSAFSLLNPQPLPPPTGVPRTSTTGPGLGHPAAGASSSTNTPPYRGHRYAPSSSSSAGPSFTTSAPSRPGRSATIYSERSSLFSEAPPAYTPSPTSPTSNSSSYNYQTFNPTGTRYSNSNSNSNDMGRLLESEPESHGLLAGQTYQSIPESMGGEPDDSSHFTYPHPVTWKDRVKSFDWRKHWKLVLLGLVLAVVTVGFLVSSVSGLKRQKTILIPGDSAPVTRPPAQGDDGTRLAYPPFDDYPTWASNKKCGTKQIKYNSITFSVDFSAARNVSIFQDIQEEHPPNGQDIHVSGDVVVRRSGSGTPEPSIIVETTSNDNRIAIMLDWDDKEQRLNMLTPLSIPWTDAQASPCVQIRVTMWVAPGSELDSLNIQNVHLGVQLLDNLSLRLGNFARLASTVGPIVSATDGVKDAMRLMREAPPSSFQVDTRFVEVKTMSSPISGSWPLFDYLGLETISGTIRAGVQPKEALREKPLPAILYAHSTSGHLEIQEPVGEALATWAMQQDGGITEAGAEALIPPRQYSVDLYSMSGDIKATVAFGRSCKVHTTSGHVDLALLPVLDKSQAAGSQAGAASSKNSLLSTTSTSGTTVITVLEAMWTDIESRKYTSAPTEAGNGPSAPDAPNPPSAPSAPRAPVPVGDSDPYDLLNSAKRTNIVQPSPPNLASAPAQPGQPGAPSAAAARPAPPALRALTSRHTATSASIRVSYPPSWEGYIDADSLSGRIEVGGEGVQIVRRENEFPGIKRHVLAHKGEEGAAAGMIKVHTTSGDVGVHVRS